MFTSVLKQNPKNVYALVHLAENKIQGSDFRAAVDILARAQHVVDRSSMTVRMHQLNAASSLNGDSNALNIIRANVEILVSSLTDSTKRSAHDSSKVAWREFQNHKTIVLETIETEHHANILSSVYSLMAVSLFRLSPAEPEVSLILCCDDNLYFVS